MNQSPSSGSRKTSSTCAHYALVGAVAAVVVFWRLGVTTLEDHECKVGLAARTMIQPGLWLLNGRGYQVPPNTTFNHWMVPVDNGQPRLAKTPLPYWTAAGTAMIHRKLRLPGPAVNAWTVRLPSAVAAVLCAFATLAIGRRMFPPRVALLGAVFLATCVGFQKWGRDGRPEMMLCMFVTAAMGAFYRGIESPRRSGHVAWMAAFWVLLGLANLDKQFVPVMIAWPLVAYLCWRQGAADRGADAALRWLRVFVITAGAGLAVHVLVTGVPALHWWRVLGISGEIGAYTTMAAAFGLPLAWYFIRSRAWRAVVPLLPTALPGAVVAAAMFVPWLVYVGRLFPALAEEVMSHEVADRAAGTGGWAVAEPWVYLQALITFSLPWLAFLPGAFATGFMRRFETERRGLVYLLLWCLGLVLLMTASAAKREHYILPMLPALCLLMGHVADDVLFKHRWVKPNVARLLGLPYGLLGVAGVAAILVKWVASGQDVRWIHMLLVTLAAAVPMTASGVLTWRRRFRLVPALMAASIVLVYVGYHQRGDLWDDRRTVANFARRASTIIPPSAPVYHWKEPQSKTVFYFGRYIPSVQSQLAVAAGQAVPGQPDDQFRRWLQEDGDRAPWIFGYARGAERLLAEGYRPVLEMTTREQRRLTFVLYHRAGLPASGPVVAQPAVPGI